MKASCFAAALMGLTILLGAADSDTAFKPVLSDKSIQFEGKTLELSEDGRVLCNSKEFGTLITMNMYFYVTVNGKDDYSWQTKKFDKENSTFTRNGNQYLWDLQYRAHDNMNIELQQELEVLPNGKVKFHAKFTLPGNAETYVYHSGLSFRMNDSAWSKETVSGSDAPFVLDPSLQPTIVSSKNPVLTFGSTNPAKKFSISFNPEEMRFFQLYYRKNFSCYAIEFFPIKTKMDYTIYLDFTKGK